MRLSCGTTGLLSGITSASNCSSVRSICAEFIFMRAPFDSSFVLWLSTGTITHGVKWPPNFWPAVPRSLRKHPGTKTFLSFYASGYASSLWQSCGVGTTMPWGQDRESPLWVKSRHLQRENACHLDTYRNLLL